MGLGGTVANNSNGAVIEIEGPSERVEEFAEELIRQLPPLARVADMQQRDVATRGETAFRIERSQRDAQRRPEVTPDAATCRDCLNELFDPDDRRYRYPFINCTNCGPRYSIICTVPYDRPATTMAEFEFCEPCRREYEDPADRRFHAQPNACPVCGPQLWLQRPDSSSIDGDPIVQAARLLSEGGILAVKGIGGYHLACRADRHDVVESLRVRKLRDGKPLAVMVPDIESAQRICRLTQADVDALQSPAAPIVLAPKNDGHGLADAVAPQCRDFGVFLPYAPVHHLLFAEGLGPLVMTSANLAGQPLTYEDDDALATLGDVADAFLMHNRRIFRPIDDSVVLTFRETLTPIRRARGYAPRPIRLDAPLCRTRSAETNIVSGGPWLQPWGTRTDHPFVSPAAEATGHPRGERSSRTAQKPAACTAETKILAVGAELKSTVCLYRNGEATLSEHLGDLTNADAYRNFISAIDRLKELYEFTPDVVAYDLHPQYLSTSYARQLDLPTVAVQHHYAHIVSVMAEWGQAGPIVGLACDGVGYGSDGAAWGCEVLRCTLSDFERLGHLDYFPLVGGNAAAIETWRPAAALLRQALPEAWRERFAGLSDEVLEQFDRQADSRLNAPDTSSLGRVFDAVSFLLGLCERNRHEAEAAIALEAVATDGRAQPYPYEVAERDERITLSVLQTMAEIAAAVERGEPVSRVSSRFHETTAAMLADAGAIACEMSGVDTVGLSGGCFANRVLLRRLVELLEPRKLRVLYHREVPCGDGGIALGQAVAAAWHTK
jgi:hydrogenase maturation protein HypF